MPTKHVFTYRNARPSSVAARALAVTFAVVLFGSLLPVGAGASSGWVLQMSANGRATGSGLVGVSCATATRCEAVGFGTLATNGPVSSASVLFETRRGNAWVLERSRRLPIDVMDAVSCTSTRFCMAVGGVLAERFNGATWTLTKPRLPGVSTLDDVSCVSDAWCAAVGVRLSSGRSHTLIETWNGRNWNQAKEPAIPSGNDGLQAVTCRSAAWCVAVGAISNASGSQSATLVVRWNGATWAVVGTPDPSTRLNVLNAVSCGSGASCVAVGSGSSTPGVTGNTLVLAFNGSTWSIVPSPNGGEVGALNGVDCTSSSSCVAVGAQRATPTSVDMTLVESLSVGTWRVVASPDSPVRWSNELSSVACTGPQRCVAVGEAATDASSSTLVVAEG